VGAWIGAWILVRSRARAEKGEDVKTGEHMSCCEKSGDWRN
jgi:hypothetical protein